MLSFLRRKKSDYHHSLQVDIHSHLLPGIDDGVETIDQSIEIISRFVSLGYSRLVTTPHIMQGFYNNTPTIIKEKLKIVSNALEAENINCKLYAAAEYYLDEYFVSLIDIDDELLTFGDNYVLFETGFMSEPMNLKEVIFKLKSKGYNPILAHPERYGYLNNNLSLVEDLVNRGVLMQVNVNSLSGHYSKEIKKMAEKLIDKKLVHFLGSDCHHINHINLLEDTRTRRYYFKALELDLLNNSILL